VSPASAVVQVSFFGLVFLMGTAGMYLGMIGRLGDPGASIICTLSSKDILRLGPFCTEFDFFSVGGLGLLTGDGPMGGRVVMSVGKALGGPRGDVMGDTW